MRYQGSKFKMRKILKNIIENNIDEDESYIEPFMGGCNSLAYINHKNKIGCDCNRYIVALWNELKNGTFTPPYPLSKDEYNDIRNNYRNTTGKYSDALTGYVGACCSYGSGWFNSYAEYNEKKKEDHIEEAKNGLMKQLNDFINLDQTTFLCQSYDELVIDRDSFIYCDPPYQATKKYESDFDSFKFFDWCRLMVSKGHKVLISEYNAPDDFVCIWEKKMQDGMSKVNKEKVERLFIHKEQINIFKL